MAESQMRWETPEVLHLALLIKSYETTHVRNSTFAVCLYPNSATDSAIQAHVSSPIDPCCFSPKRQSHRPDGFLSITQMALPKLGAGKVLEVFYI
ncbi:hypothetical protein [Gloeomargarita sp.]